MSEKNLPFIKYKSNLKPYWTTELTRLSKEENRLIKEWKAAGIHEMMIVIYGEDTKMQSILFREYTHSEKMHLMRKKFNKLKKLEN